MRIIRTLYDWVGLHVNSRYGSYILALFFFIESSVFLVPVDPLLIVYCVKKRQASWWYASVATIASVVGGVFGYFLGYCLWDYVGPFIIRWILSPELFSQAVAYYKKYEIVAVLIGGFTPVPYKAITLTAGFCQLPLVPFIVYSCLARGARFFLVAGIVYWSGERLVHFIDRYFSWLVYLFLAIAMLGCLLFCW